MSYTSSPIKSGDPIIVSVHEYQGRELLDIRHFYHADAGLAPTKKGVSLPATSVAEILKVVRAVVEIDASAPTAASNQIQVKAPVSLPVIVSVSHWKGYKRLDIRHYFSEGKKPVPTQKGVSIPWEQVVDLIDALTEATKSMVVVMKPVAEDAPARTPETIMAELGLTTEGRFSNIEL